MITNRLREEADVMMDSYSLDPYEQQLLKVFDSHDSENRGSLDKDGLIKLCETLQLEDKASELSKVLLDDRKLKRVVFDEFKDALLNLLGTMQSGDDLDINTSPEREVSPKFVYGSKKYGRRSRPRCEDIITNKEQQNDLKGVSVQRSNSQSEVTYSKKRKTNIKLKRCTSVPSVNDYQQKTDGMFQANVGGDVVCTEEMLRQAWRKLGVGKDGYLNQTELIVVCDAIGLNKLADSVIRQLSNKLVLDYNKRISFQDLLGALQQDETWHEFLNSPPLSTNFETNISMSYQDVKPLSNVKFGPDGSGHISSDSMLELWEQAGIASPKVLLTDLGFKGRYLQIQELSSVLEKEIKGLNELRIDHTCNPHVALLHAFLTLHQTEIRYLKNLLEQMQDEREKLKCDVAEANNRATLLAQEVDDNVANMEVNTQKHVKLMEQRHADLLKDVTEQLTSEKEHMTTLNQNLELKLKALENDESKLRDDLLHAQKYANSLDKENQELNYKISELEQLNNAFVKQIDALELEKLKSRDAELEQHDKLLIKLNELQLDNTNLRDKHDEMVSKIEALANENLVLKCKHPMSLEQSEDSIDNISAVCEGINLGTKRRSNKTSKVFGGLSEVGHESPCLGKLRRFQKSSFTSLEHPMSLNDSGYDTEQSCQSATGEEIARLQNRITYLETLFESHLMEIPTGTEQETLQDDCQGKAIKPCKFKSMLIDIKERIESSNYQNLTEYLGRLIDGENSSNDDSMECERPSSSEDSDNDRLKLLELENKELTTKCEDLENGMAMLRNEYEKCEDYWQSKLDDERRLFEQEQNHNTEKLNELLTKLADFEEQYLKENRLPTIVESGNLENQFTDLEQEFKEYKDVVNVQLEDKEFEINTLKGQLSELCFKTKEFCDVSVQISDEMLKNRSQLSNHVIEATNLYSADAMPFNWNESVNETITQNFAIEQTTIETVNWNRDDSTSSVPSNWETASNQKSSFSFFSLPSTSHSNVWENKTMPYRQKRTRHHDRLLTQHRLQKKNNDEAKSNECNASPANCSVYPELNNETKNHEPKCWIPVAILHSLQAKKYSLEQRCKKLQYILKQQHHYDEQLLHYSWQQYRSEKTELQHYIKYYHDKLEQQLRVTGEQQERLARNDSLVKDLFVDNSYLLAKNQRLEQQYHMLANNLNTNSV